MTDTNSNIFGGAESDLALRAGAAADSIEFSVDLEDASRDDAASVVLAALGRHRLLEFGFSDPASSGPQPGDMARACEIMRVLAARSGTIASIYMLSGLLAPICVSCAGSTDQKRELLSRAASGTLQMAFALTEPEAGSDAAAIGMRATPLGHGAWRLDGDKTYITGASSADLILTVAKTSHNNPQSFGLFLVPRGTNGLSIEPLGKIAGNSYPSCRMRYDRVEVSANAALGGVEAIETAWPILRKTGTLERLIVCAMACGLAEAATARATEFVRERRQFGQLLKDFQAIQHTIVEMSTLTKAIALFVRNAIQDFESGGDATQSISMAKYFASEQLQAVVQMAVRVMGGRAFFDFEPVSRFYREAPFCLFAGGTVEIQKMLIARTLSL